MEKINQNPNKTITPISTIVIEGAMYFGFIGLFLLIYNPLSMLLWHIFFPEVAVKLANDRFFVDEQLTKFYTKRALKWPFYWAKWWITPEMLPKYKVDQQLNYFREVNNSPEIVNHFSKKAQAKLVQMYPLQLKEIMEQIKVSDDLLKEILKQNRTELLQAYLRRSTVRISDEIFEAILKLRPNLLKEYLQRGTISRQQQELLVDYATKDSKLYLVSPTIQLLYNYTERCGLKRDLMDQIRSGRGAVWFKIEMNNQQLSYEQKCAVRHMREVFDSSWEKYLRSQGSLSQIAEEEMSERQYIVYKNLGRSLHQETIIHWLQKPQKGLLIRVFQMEKLTPDIKELVDANPILTAFYKEAVPQG